MRADVFAVSHREGAVAKGAPTSGPWPACVAPAGAIDLGRKPLVRWRPWIDPFGQRSVLPGLTLGLRFRLRCALSGRGLDLFFLRRRVLRVLGDEFVRLLRRFRLGSALSGRSL